MVRPRAAAIQTAAGNVISARCSSRARLMTSKIGITSCTSGVLLCDICFVAIRNTCKHTSENSTPIKDTSKPLKAGKASQEGPTHSSTTETVSGAQSEIGYVVRRWPIDWGPHAVAVRVLRAQRCCSTLWQHHVPSELPWSYFWYRHFRDLHARWGC